MISTRLIGWIPLLVLVVVGSCLSSQTTATMVPPSPTELAIPLCSQIELVQVGSLITANADKKNCEAELNVKEMLRVKAEEVKALCEVSSCLAAFKQLYTALPNCRYLDWAIKYNFKRLLMHCGIDPRHVEAVGSSHNEAIRPADPNATSSSSSSDCGELVIPITKSPVQGNVPYQREP